MNDALFQKKKHIMSYDENSLERELIENLNDERSIHLDGKRMKNGRKSPNK